MSCAILKCKYLWSTYLVVGSSRGVTDTNLINYNNSIVDHFGSVLKIRPSCILVSLSVCLSLIFSRINRWTDLDLFLYYFLHCHECFTFLLISYFHNLLFNEYSTCRYLFCWLYQWRSGRKILIPPACPIFKEWDKETCGVLKDASNLCSVTTEISHATPFIQ